MRTLWNVITFFSRNDLLLQYLLIFYLVQVNPQNDVDGNNINSQLIQDDVNSLICAVGNKSNQ